MFSLPEIIILLEIHPEIGCCIKGSCQSQCHIRSDGTSLNEHLYIDRQLLSNCFQGINCWISFTVLNLRKIGGADADIFGQLFPFYVFIFSPGPDGACTVKNGKGKFTGNGYFFSFLNGLEMCLYILSILSVFHFI